MAEADCDTARDALELARLAFAALDSKSGIDIRLLDVRELTSMTDYVVVASGNSAPHLKALFAEVLRSLKERGLQAYRRTGEPEGGWMLIDYVDAVIHIFSQEKRTYYAIEALWEDAPRVV